MKDSTYIAICFINNIEQIEIANSIETAEDFAAIKIIYSLSHKDEKCELSIINSLEHLHVTIQESSINDPKPSTSSQMKKPITLNNNCVKNANSYKMKKDNNLTTSSFSTKSFRKCFQCGYRPPNEYNKFFYKHSLPIQEINYNGALQRRAYARTKLPKKEIQNRLHQDS